MGLEVIFEPLGPQHDRAEFSCGEPVLDVYLRQQASQDVRRRIAQAFVAVDASTGRVAGYYTLSAASFFRQDLPDKLAKRLPRYPVPAAIMGRLAVDQAFKGQGLGALLLADAVKRLIRASETLAVYALIVDAKNDAARSFYEKFGFQRFPATPNRLFLPLDPIIKSRAGRLSSAPPRNGGHST